MQRSIITNFEEFNRVWNAAKSIQEVADHYHCSRSVLYGTKDRARQIYPTMQFKMFPTYDIESIVPKPCSEPTSASPGTKEKVEVLAIRIENEEELWHDLDKNDFSGIDTALVKQGVLDLRTGNNVRI